MGSQNILLNERLSSGLQFNAEDLAANQKRELTANQRSLLLKYRPSFVFIGVFASIFLWILAVFSLIGLLLVQDRLLPYLLLWLLFIFALSGTFMLVRLRNVLVGKVYGVDGHALTSIKQRRQTTHYGVRIGRQKFSLKSSEALAAFEDKVLYRVYYMGIPPFYIILSAEALVSS